MLYSCCICDVYSLGGDVREVSLTRAGSRLLGVYLLLKHDTAMLEHFSVETA